MNRSLLIMIIKPLLALTVASGLPAQQATVVEEQQVIKTYPFSGPDPAPIMMRSSMWGKGPKLYPYFFFDNLSYTASDQSWNVVRMENPYIEISVIPAEGGKLIGAVEKSTGKAFIYRNHVRKFRHIALRGPWTSGGIELNFGLVGHTPATATPVDYIIQKNPDGSVSCVVGAMDLPSRTQWRVKFTLPPDKAYFETHSLYYNPQPLNQSYYVWMNAANKLSDDLEFIFPGKSYIGHDYGAPERPWPKTPDGRNLALYKEHEDSDEGSYFVHGVMDDFNGGYWHDSEFGYGHWALYEDVPGQKFFRWSLSRAGAIWGDLLTDNDGLYFEPQMGRLLDQNDHEFLAPYTGDQWREVWFPFKKIGPMVKATPYGALNARIDGGTLTIGFNALQKIDEELVVRSGDKEVYRERLRLGPMEVYEKKLSVAVNKGDLRVDLGDKLSYSDAPEAGVLKRPLNFREYDENSVEALYQAAERAEKERNYGAALEKYLACLKREPNHMRALTRVAEIFCRRAEYDTALEFATRALDYVMYDPDANYIYGVISRKMGNLLDARETLGWAARSMKYRSGAYCQIAEIYLLEGKLERALEYLRRSLDYDARNIKTHQVLSTVYRLLEKPEESGKLLSKTLALDPLNHQARFEEYLIDPSDEKLDNFKSLIRNELPHETYLEIALYYASLGLDEDALRLIEVAPEQPTLRYWQAYLLRTKSPERSRELLGEAAGLSPYLVFPFREESLPVFEWADKTLAGNWKAKYYLGLIYWGLRRHDDARRVLAANGNRPDYAPFYICRAYLAKDADPRESLADYNRAYEADKNDWRNWRHLAMAHTEQGAHNEAMKLAVEASKQFPDEDLIKILLARTYLNNGRYEACYSVLENATILPFEGQSDVHELFVQCQISMALGYMKQELFSQAIERLESSKEYPERLGTGSPHDPDYRVQDYLLALCHEKLGDSTQAGQTREGIQAYASRHRKEDVSAICKQVDQWYEATLASERELDALRELSKLVLGGGEIRH